MTTTTCHHWDLETTSSESQVCGVTCNVSRVTRPCHLRGHVEVVGGPAAAALVVLDLEPGLQQPPVEAAVISVHVLVQTLPALASM